MAVNTLSEGDYILMMKLLDSRDTDLIAQGLMLIEPLSAKIRNVFDNHSKAWIKNCVNVTQPFDMNTSALNRYPQQEPLDLSLPGILSRSMQANTNYMLDAKYQEYAEKKEKKLSIIYKFPSKRPVQCSLCGKIVRADNFHIHMRNHTGEKPHKCPICPFRSAYPSSLPKHIQAHDKISHSERNN